MSAKRYIAEFGNLLKRLKSITSFIYREAISARACSVTVVPLNAKTRCPAYVCTVVRWMHAVEADRKAKHLYSALHGIQTTLKRSGMDHTVYPQ